MRWGEEGWWWWRHGAGIKCGDGWHVLDDDESSSCLSDEEEVSLGDGAVGLLEVGLEVHVEQVARHALSQEVTGQAGVVSHSGCGAYRATIHQNLLSSLHIHNPPSACCQ